MHSFLWYICLSLQKRFEGTRVTIETFLAWKTKFDAEMDEIKRRQGKLNTTNNKLSGKSQILTVHAEFFFFFFLKHDLCIFILYHFSTEIYLIVDILPQGIQCQWPTYLT